MKLTDGLRLRARELTRLVEEGVTDSGQVAVYLRQLLRGNRAAPSIAERGTGARPAAAWQAGRPPPPPVLLIHGYMANRGSVHLLESRLTELGHVVMTYPLGPLHLGDIRQSAVFIERKVDSLVTQTGVPQIDIVAHSMGGLVALDYVKRLGGARRTRKLILLGTPTRGTWAAALGLFTVPLGRASLQLLPGSSFLRELLQAPLPAGPEVTAMAAERDWLAPPRTTLLPGVRRLSVPTGHTGLLVDEQIAFRIAEVLREPSPRNPAPTPAGPS
jgi:pimeloyl-ACP methyl ester carboxylesterase